MSQKNDRPSIPSRMPSVKAGPNVSFSKVHSIEDEFYVVLAGLMEGGQKDEGAIQTLKALTQLLSRENEADPPTGKDLAKLVDHDCFDTLLSYCDNRQDATVRGYGTLALSAYLKASEERGVDQLRAFFNEKMKRQKYDDYIMAFSAASCAFPLIPDTASELFLQPGFVESLGKLMKRTWKSKRVEGACLGMLNTATMHAKCREAIKKHCLEWLEEVASDEAVEEAKVSGLEEEKEEAEEDGPLQQRIHSPYVKNLAAVILAKLQSTDKPNEAKVQLATTDISDLATRFTKSMALAEEPTIQQTSAEGLAYASLNPQVKEQLANDKAFLKNLVNFLAKADARSSDTYGGLVILVNLTSYLPRIDEKQKKITQLRAYASGSTHLPPDQDPLNLPPHVEDRCRAIFKAGVVPVLSSHSYASSPTCLKLIAQILNSLSSIKELRGPMTQQGAVKLLLYIYKTLPAEEGPPGEALAGEGRNIAAHALARILISINPLHVFGGSNPHPLHSAIAPLAGLLKLDPSAEYHDLLLPFEALMALTNLASIEDDAREVIIRLIWEDVDELVLHKKDEICRAATQLICNLMPEVAGMAKFCDGTGKARNRLQILLALTDSKDRETRLAAGGAVSVLSQWDVGVRCILEQAKGVSFILNMCTEPEEAMRHRGVVTVHNMLEAPGDAGKLALLKLKNEGAVDKIKESLKLSRSQEVLEIGVECLKHLLGGGSGHLLTEHEAAKAA